MLLRVIDIETTGLSPPAEIIEIGRVDVEFDGTVCQLEKPLARLYRATNGIPPETMAVHHITHDDFAPDDPICTPEELRAAIWTDRTPDVLVAHNAGFESSFIQAATTGALPWLCTHKAALRLWPDAPGHSNQILRYWRGLRLDAADAMPPHRAGPDAWVTASLLVEMMKMASVEQMVAWSAEPKLLPRMPFGKHRNQAWADIPTDYLQWMSKQVDMDGDVLWCARKELGSRAGR